MKRRILFHTLITLPLLAISVYIWYGILYRKAERDYLRDRREYLERDIERLTDTTAAPHL